MHLKICEELQLQNFAFYVLLFFTKVKPPLKSLVSSIFELYIYEFLSQDQFHPSNRIPSSNSTVKWNRRIRRNNGKVNRWPLSNVKNRKVGSGTIYLHTIPRCVGVACFAHAHLVEHTHSDANSRIYRIASRIPLVVFPVCAPIKNHPLPCLESFACKCIFQFTVRC